MPSFGGYKSKIFYDYKDSHLLSPKIKEHQSIFNLKQVSSANLKL